MPPIKKPSVRLRQLARELRSHREAADVTRDEVVDALGLSAPTMSRIENASTVIGPDLVASMLDYYGATADKRAELIQLAKDAARRGWWETYIGAWKGAFVGLEQEADELWSYEPQLIPGLMQTSEYTRDVITATPSARPDETHERRIRARMARQTIVTRPDPPKLHFVLGQAVFHQEIGGKQVMRGQLARLWEDAQRPNVTVQVVPFSAGAHFGLDGSFVLLKYREAGMEIGFHEGPGGQIYLESAADLADLNLRRDGILRAALSPEESADLIRRYADDLRE